ncbi:MAG: hypothetical protein ACTHK0_03190 [Ginsengibacter sp.]
MNKRFCYRTLQVLIFFTASCNGISGKYPLGNHLSLWDNDKKEEKIIVYCEGNCNGGIYVVPTYEGHYDSTKQHYAEYVEEAKSNKKWVIVKTFRVKEKQENYYIINKDFDIRGLDCGKANCDSILQSYVTGPLTLNDFNNNKKALNVNLDF